jgi:hypothetical protein
LTIKRNNFKFTVEDFADWYARNKIDHRNYVRLRTVKKLFSPNSLHSDYSAMMRILLSQFLKQEASLCYLTSKKTGKEDPMNNFKAIRSIIFDLVA